MWDHSTKSEAMDAADVPPMNAMLQSDKVAVVTVRQRVPAGYDACETSVRKKKTG